MDKLYVIYFVGHYPVGAVAIVTAKSKEEAKEIFKATLEEEEPSLVRHNNFDDPRYTLDICEYDPTDTPCCILLNGNH